jgi:putative Ig domain-containing protein/matrixin/Ig-like domain-containing protein
MERVFKQTPFKSVIIPVLLFLCLAHSSFATTVTIPFDDDMVIGARAIVRGKVGVIESSFDEQSGRIYTYITVKVQEVLKGQIAVRKIVLKELGGQVGDKINLVYGNPQFKRGERVLLYLDTWADGSLRTYQMFLGKFNIVTDPITGEDFAVRSSPDENTTVLKQHLHGHNVRGESTERQTLSRYLRLIRNRLAANWERSVQFDSQYYANRPFINEPAEYRSIAERGDINPDYTFLGPYRFFEPDNGQPVAVTLNPNPSGEQGVPQVTLNSADVAAAGGAWSNVQGCALQTSFTGSLNQCYLGSGIPGIHVVSNNCDGRNGATAGCASILAWGGVSVTGFGSKVINGTTFTQTVQGFVSMNPWANCSFGNSCNVREILTHEIGHALGLGHSQFSDATMAAFAHFDGRCASIRTDDVNGICAIYPGSGGSGQLTITTSSLSTGTVGTSYNQSLSASGGTPPYGWSLVAGSGTLPAGLNLSGAGVISGTPTVAGTSNFTVKVTDNVAATVQKALSIVVSPAGGGGALNSQFVSQVVPTSVQPGETFNSTLRFLNTGTQEWSGTAFFFASQNPALNQTWGGNGVSLFGFVALPGQTLEVTFTATAPTTTGTYNFQWQMYENGGVGFFGQMSTNVSIQVGSTPPPQNVWETIGLFRSTGNMFYLRNGNTVGAPDISTAFGAPGDIPIVGDWDGNGTMTIGLYRPSSSTFFLRNTNAPGFPDVIVSFGDGLGGDKPIVGDWDGDGVWTIGVYRPSSSTFYLRNSNTIGFPDISVSFGAPGDLPVVGDWDGNGTMTIGLFRPTGNVFFLRNTNTLGFPDITVAFGATGDVPIVGDWNGDGTTTIGLFRPSGNFFFLRNSNSTGFPDIIVPFGAPGDMPIVGNWDGQ